jgi:dienelactone hydrolase
MGPASTRDVSFAGAASDSVSALLVAASAPPLHAGLLFLHWGFGDRTSFAAEALALAPCGVTSLLIDAPGSGERRGPRIPARDASLVRAYAEQLLGDLARALDFLCAQPGIDPARIGYVGHSLGATIAPAFLAREPRVRAAVLMAGTGALSRLWLSGRNEEAARSLEDLDGVRCLPRVSAALLFQFAERDEFIARADADAQIAAAREPKQVLHYECGHELDARALQDRARWLGAQLGLTAEPNVPPGDWLPRKQVRVSRVIGAVLRATRWFSRRS